MKIVGIICFLFFNCLLNAQNNPLNFTHIAATVQPFPSSKKIQGYGSYTFVLREKMDSIFIDAQKMAISEFKLDDKDYPFVNTGKNIGFKAPSKLGEHKLYISFGATPNKALYFVGFEDNIIGNEQIWTQGQGKYTSNWLPSFDDMIEKVEFDLSIIYDENYKVIANGNLKQSRTENGLTQWSFDMQNPMSSYLLAFAIGKYDKQELMSHSGIPIINYYYPADSLKVEPTYRHTKRIFDFLETEIGVAYPWQNYKQIPVHDFLYAGMENTGATIFSDTYVIDSVSFIDRNYVNINAHELAHQWFGNLVTEETGEHHWLQEGFATYYAYLAEKELFGEDYFYWRLFETGAGLIQASEKGSGQSLLDPKASSLTFYEKGAWALVMLREKLGDQDFKKGIKNYLTKYQFKNVTVADFLNEMEAVSSLDLNDFSDTWLRDTLFPKEEVKDFLIKHNHAIKRYYVLEHEHKNIAITNETLEDHALPAELKLELLKQKDEISSMQFSSLMLNGDLKIRQFAAERFKIIPLESKKIAENLLFDGSYVTTELMLYNLWNSFEYDRKTYLNKTKGVIGLPNKNVRLLWLTLALVTPEYNPEERIGYFEELEGYTNAAYNPEVRQNAFQYLSEIQALKGLGLVNLIKATNHHSWQFRNFARSLLDSRLEDELQKKEVVRLANQLNSSDLRYLKTKIDLQ